MKRITQVFVLALMPLFILTMAAMTMTGNHRKGDHVQKVAMTQQSWTLGHTASSEVAYNLNGVLTRFDVITSDDSNNVTVAVTFRDENSCIIVPDAVCATLADNSQHIKLAKSNKSSPDADFNPVPFCDTDLTIAIDPNAEPNETDGFTVDVILYLE